MDVWQCERCGCTFAWASKLPPVACPRSPCDQLFPALLRRAASTPNGQADTQVAAFARTRGRPPPRVLANAATEGSSQDAVELPLPDPPEQEAPSPLAPPPAPTVPAPDTGQRGGWVPLRPRVPDKPLPLRGVAVDGEGQFLVCLGHHLTAFRVAGDNLEIRWEYDARECAAAPPVVGADRNVRLHTRDGRLHCVAVETGKPRWSADVGPPLGYATPLVDERLHTWVCASGGGLLRVNPNGRLIHPTRPATRRWPRFDSTGLLHRGTFYVGAEDHHVYALDLGSEPARNTWDHSARRGWTTACINSALALSPGPVLVVSSQDRFLYGFDLDGRQVWREPLIGQVLGSPRVDDDGRLYVGISRSKRGEPGQGWLFCLAADGNRLRKRWQYPAEGAAGVIESRPVLGDDGVLYFGDNAGTVHAIRAEDGEPLWQERVGSPVGSLGALVAPGRLVFGLDSGELAVLCCSSRCAAGGPSGPGERAG